MSLGKGESLAVMRSPSQVVDDGVIIFKGSGAAMLTG